MAAMIAAGIGAAGSIIGGKSASKGAQKAAGMADPFASQRGMYQGILANLYGGMATGMAGQGYAPAPQKVGTQTSAKGAPRQTADTASSLAERYNKYWANTGEMSFSQWLERQGGSNAGSSQFRPHTAWSGKGA